MQPGRVLAWKTGYQRTILATASQPATTHVLNVAERLLQIVHVALLITSWLAQSQIIVSTYVILHARPVMAIRIMSVPPAIPMRRY